MIILIGNTQDGVMQYFGTYLVDEKTPFLFLDQACLGKGWNYSYKSANGACNFSITIGEKVITLNEIDAIYYRPAAADIKNKKNEKLRILRSEFYSIIEALSCLVVNRPSAMSSNGSKPYQAKLALDYDNSICNMPSTYITNNSKKCIKSLALGAWNAKEHIYKSISGVRSKVDSVKNRPRKDFNRVDAFPVQFQRMVKGDKVRVHVIGDRCFPVRITSGAVDYRYGENKMVVTKLNSSLERFCINVTKHLGLHFSGIDLIDGKHGWTILEINPSPGFSYFQKNTRIPIAQYLKEYLLNKGRMNAPAKN